MKTRFAPSPTGYLHIGNVYSAYYCQHWAEQHKASIVLRIEDIDFTRCRDHFRDALLHDLEWLGMSWCDEVLYQHQRIAAYQQALQQLKNLGVLYPCSCTRSAIQQHGIQKDYRYPNADPYQGYCRNKNIVVSEQAVAWRLNIEKAMSLVKGPLYWYDSHDTPHHVVTAEHGDVVVARKDIGVSYHLAVVVDDAYQQISHVIRGEDLRSSTGIHRLLQSVLALPSPRYIHHPLLYAPNQQKWSKKNKAPSLHKWRESGWSAQQVKHYVYGLGGFDEY